MVSTSWTPGSVGSTNWTPSSVNSTNFTADSVNSTNFTPVDDVTGSRTLSVGSPMGLLLALTYAEAGTVTFRQYDTEFTAGSTNSTNWTPS